MAETKTTIFEFIADTSKLETELKQTGNTVDSFVGKVEGSSKKLADTVPKATSKIKDLGTNSSKAGKSLDKLGDSADKTASAAGGLATAVSVVNPELGGLIRSVGDLSTGGGVAIKMLGSFSGSLGKVAMISGPLVVAVMALGAAWLYFKNQLDDANKASDEAAKKATEMVDHVTKIKRLRNEELVVTGELGQEIIDLEKITTDAEAKKKAVMEETSGAIEESKKKIEDLMVREAQNYQAIEDEKKVRDNLLAAQAESIRKIDEERDALGFIMLARKTAADADKTAADAADAKRIADEKAVDAAKRRQAANAIVKAGLEELIAIEKSATEATLTLISSEEENFERSFEVRRKGIEETAQKAIDAAGNSASKIEEIEVQKTKSLIALDQEAAAMRQAIRDEENAKKLEEEATNLEAIAALREEANTQDLSVFQEHEEAKRSSAQDNQDAIVDMSLKSAQAIEDIAALYEKKKQKDINKTMKDLQKAQADGDKAEVKRLKERLKEERKALKVAEAMQKGAAIAQIIISTGVAMMKAMELGIPAGPIFAAGIGIMGAAQVATVASTSGEYHTGGMINSNQGISQKEMQDETTIKVLNNEAVLTKRGVDALGGERGVNLLNKGIAPTSYQSQQEDFRIFLRDHEKAALDYDSKLNPGFKNPYR